MEGLTPLEQRALVKRVDALGAAVKLLISTVDSFVKREPALAAVLETAGDRLQLADLRSKLAIALAEASPEATRLRTQLSELELALEVKHRGRNG